MNSKKIEVIYLPLILHGFVTFKKRGNIVKLVIEICCKCVNLVYNLAPRSL